MHALRRDDDARVRVVVRVQQLQRRLLAAEHAALFAAAWNWADAHLQITHGADSERYAFLRQAMLARRTLLIFDGIDEGGRARSEIESHLTSVLAPQGFVMFVTSRPAGLREPAFRSVFHRAYLQPLTESQQRQVIEQRLGDAARAEELWRFVDERVPIDTESGARSTGNPLMLSMIISTYEARARAPAPPSPPSTAASTAIDGPGSMPATIAELYSSASSAMLSRIDSKLAWAQRPELPRVVPHLPLLEATAFRPPPRRRVNAVPARPPRPPPCTRSHCLTRSRPAIPRPPVLPRA